MKWCFSLGFLSGRRSADDSTGGKPLFRLFNRETVDDIPTTLPKQLTPRRQNVCSPCLVIEVFYHILIFSYMNMILGNLLNTNTIP